MRAFQSGEPSGLAAPPTCQGNTMFDKNMSIEGFDDEIFSAIAEEERRQEEHIELIASKTTPACACWRPREPAD